MNKYRTYYIDKGLLHDEGAVWTPWAAEPDYDNKGYLIEAPHTLAALDVLLEKVIEIYGSWNPRINNLNLMVEDDGLTYKLEIVDE